MHGEEEQAIDRLQSQADAILTWIDRQRQGTNDKGEDLVPQLGDQHLKEIPQSLSDPPFSPSKVSPEASSARIGQQAKDPEGQTETPFEAEISRTPENETSIPEPGKQVPLPLSKDVGWTDPPQESRGSYLSWLDGWTRAEMGPNCTPCKIMTRPRPTHVRGPDLRAALSQIIEAYDRVILNSPQAPQDYGSQCRDRVGYPTPIPSAC